MTEAAARRRRPRSRPGRVAGLVRPGRWGGVLGALLVYAGGCAGPKSGPDVGAGPGEGSVAETAEVLVAPEMPAAPTESEIGSSGVATDARPDVDDTPAAADVDEPATATATATATETETATADAAASTGDDDAMIGDAGVLPSGETDGATADHATAGDGTADDPSLPDAAPIPVTDDDRGIDPTPPADDDAIPGEDAADDGTAADGSIADGAAVDRAAADVAPAERAPAADDPPAPRPLPDDVVALFDRHDARAQDLARIHLRGIATVRFREAGGTQRTEDQVDLRIWVDGPWRTGAHFTKLGQDLFWFGSDARLAWLIDAASDQRALFLLEHAPVAGRSTAADRAGDEATLSDGDGDGDPDGPGALGDLDGDPARRDRADDAAGAADDDPLLLARPLAMIDLLFGAVPVPPEVRPNAIVNRAAGTVRLRIQGRLDPLRLTWDLGTGRLRRVEVLDPDGGVVVTAEHEGEQRMRLPNRAEFFWARIPSRVEVREAGDRFSARVSFDAEASASIERQPWDRLFDLERLERRFRPDVQYVPRAWLPSEPAGGGGR